MKHLTYFTWPELKVGDKFRFAGYDDLFLKLDAARAKCLGCYGGGNRLAKKFETVEVSPNTGGLLLSI